ncbi:acetyl-CoA carboxylase biotin carboxylase subunit [Shouchella patagoniensis]|uniref:acetyl-CoA carboxylase biotin carboxylase subunit n=1 Tax=Shouchella patagoniensis TaxID=228576 RepID=UPI000994B6A8|nr:acetyl-CoA carboxylase biotin carboxylase subunit [Shouchella patagoniensis]
MIQSILIANRGEIASRIIRTCQKMGIKTVSVYSDADKQAEHVQIADRAFHVGPSRVHESYLNQETIIACAKEADVDAIHPGYGLLSEQSSFAENCEKNGFIFIGPNANSISLMGDKLQARETMVHAGIPVVPGSADLQSKEAVVEEAKKIGYPVMLKAASGGGGIGIDICHTDEECRNAYEKNKKKAAMFFGDGSLYLEKGLVNPRHIEVQVIADKSGNILTVGERDCSIQRRHQKIVEEAPALDLSENTREKMYHIAKKAVSAIGYENAGTIEFLVDEDEMFYFLEMNTRLQVEHPVTEEVFGVDLVEWQIRIAAGEDLPWKQEDMNAKGHAIEVRVYAEDPVRFLPSPGTITEIQKPDGTGVRHECPVKTGSVITPFYDPMIAKMIIKGRNRVEAIEQLTRALETYRISGIKTNLATLRGIVNHPAFKKGNVNTSFMTVYGNELRLEEENK